MGFRFTKQIPDSKTSSALLLEVASDLKSYAYLKPNKPLKVTEESSDDIQEIKGGINMIRIQSYPVSRQLYDPERFEPLSQKESKIRVAISKLHKHDKTRLTPARKAILAKSKRLQIETTKSAFDLLRKGHSTLFIHHFLYQGQKGTVSIAASCDLWDWISINKNRVTEKQLTEIIEQALLAINTLHAQNLVHRDIKLENFLVYETHDRIYLQLADLDGVIEEKQNVLPDSYTKECLAPECKFSSVNSFVIDEEVYKNLAKKPIDCYATGYMLWAIAEGIIDNPEITRSYKEKLAALYTPLMQRNPLLRCTIQDALSNTFFGTTDILRNEYVNNLLEKHKPKADIYYDDYYYNPTLHSYPQFNDAFFLLSAPLKEIFLEVSSLANQVQLIEKNIYCLEPEHIYAIENKLGKLEDLMKKNLTTIQKEHNNDPKLLLIFQKLQTTLDKIKYYLSSREVNDLIIQKTLSPY